MKQHSICTSILAALACTLVACSNEASKTSPSETKDMPPAGMFDRDAQASAQSSQVPDWFPEEIFLPEDFVVGMARKFGTQTYFMRGASSRSLSALMGSYEANLQSIGYRIDNQAQTSETEYVAAFTGTGSVETGSVTIRDLGEHRNIEISLRHASGP